jgi:hypothetical protein
VYHELYADQFRHAAIHAPVTVLVVMADAERVLLAAKLRWLRLLNQPLLLTLKLLQSLSNAK